MQNYKTTLNGHEFHIREWGSKDGPAVVFLHGFPEYSGAWGKLAECLPEFRCIAPDQRGFGQSWCPKDQDQYAPKHLAADVIALIEQIGGPLVLVGHDWGAAVAYAVAIFRPDLLSHLVILNGVHPASFQRALATGGAQTHASQYIHWLRKDGSEDRLAANDFAHLARFFAEGMDMRWFTAKVADRYKAEWSRPGRLKAMVNWYRASPLVVGTPGEVINDLPDFPVEKFAVQMPHLLIWGTQDKALLEESIANLDTYAEDLTIARLPKADHWLHHQQPQEIAAIFTHWLHEKTTPPK